MVFFPFTRVLVGNSDLHKSKNDMLDLAVTIMTF